MNKIKIKPVEIIGECPISLTMEDEFQINGMELENPNKSSICFASISQMPISTWQLQGGNRFFAHVSCPGCTMDLENENRVVFLSGHVGKWALCQSISEYLRLSKRYGEPDYAQALKELAIEFQNLGEFEQAESKMKRALRALQSFCTKEENKS